MRATPPRPGTAPGAERGLVPCGRRVSFSLASDSQLGTGPGLSVEMTRYGGQSDQPLATPSALGPNGSYTDTHDACS